MPNLTDRYEVHATPPEGWSLELGRFAPADGLSLASRLLYNRGIRDDASARAFLDADSVDISDPYELPQMETAVEYLFEAIKAKKRIAVFGDFDADGITATSIIKLALGKMGVECGYYLPERDPEGHGMSVGAVRELSESGVEVLVTVDTGTTAHDEVALARELGMDVVITDHHIPDEGKLPAAVAVVNPHLAADGAGVADYCGAGIALKLAMALLRRAGIEDYYDLIPLAAVGTVADRTELMGDNRVIVRQGLAGLDVNAPPGLVALVRTAMRQQFNGQRFGADFISFQVAPRLNAPGRLGSADVSVELLTCEDYGQAVGLASSIDAQNELRREAAREALESVQDQLQDASVADRHVVFVKLQGFPLGMLGPLAGTLNDKTGKPAVAYQVNDDGVAKASARCRGRFDLHQALTGVSHKLVRFGGHSSAAGFQTNDCDIGDVAKHLEERAQWDSLSSAGDSAARNNGDPLRMVDAELELHQLGSAMWGFVKRMEPFGTGNEEPKFIIKGCRVEQSRAVGKSGRQLAASFADYSGETVRGFGWGLGKFAPLPPFVDAVVSLRENEFNGFVQRELYIHDVVAADGVS